MSVHDVLVALREAGLGSLPGGGAEIFDDRVHDEVFKGKVRADKWFDVHRTAHSLGIFSNATMLYGHVESVDERVTHLIKLRELQAESLANSPAHFNCMIPLSFAPEHSELGHLPGNTGLSDLKTLAVSRLMLNNFTHVKAFWIMQGIGLSQVALDWGCDDLDGTVVWYDITKREGERGTPTHQELHESDIRRLIREAGRIPVERDTLYNEVVREPGGHATKSLAMA
jgi:aminodeoxyfutalosine synthase